MPKNTAKGGGWVTINGVHVFIEGGKITKGPAKFIGSSVNDLPSGKSVEDKKAALKAKYANKSGSSKSTPNSGKSSPERDDLGHYTGEGVNKKKIADSKYTSVQDAQAKLKLADMSDSELHSQIHNYSSDSVEGRAVNREMRRRAAEKLGVSSSGLQPKENARSTMRNKTKSYSDMSESELIAERNKIYEQNKKVVTKEQAQENVKKLAEIGSALSSKKTDSTKMVELGINTDFSKLTKSEIIRGIKQLEKEYNSGDPYLTDAIDRIIFKAEDALASGNFKTKATKSTTPSTGNTNFDNAKSTTKSTAKNPKTETTGEPGLQVAHYDGAGGSRNVYTAVYPDGSTKKLTATQAKEMFPDNPWTQHIKTRTTTKASSATPLAQANFNSAVSNAQKKGTGSKN